MVITYSITKKDLFKHLSHNQIDFIITTVTKHDASHGGKRRNTGRTELLRQLASDVGTTLSNIYNILHDASITILDSQLCTKHELSASAAIAKRSTRNKPSNISKLYKASRFIQLVIDEVKCNKLCSIDETIHDLVLNRPDEIKGLTTVCTKTFYNYIHKGNLDLKPIDLPRMVRRKKSINYKTYIPKRHKGTPISERPFDMDDRSEFGYWESDLVTGPRDGQNGAYLTLLERKTRFYYMIPIKRKSAKQVYMKINELEKYYGQYFSKIFKSITFDNGNEFSRHKDIEKKCETNKQRTKVYFGRPYHSCDRAVTKTAMG